MKLLSRVVWSEGMHLSPHHFQAQSRYFEDSIQFATSTLWFETYGLVGYEMNTEALRNGVLWMVHARGIFPDGLVFQMPECDPLPPTRNIADQFPPTRDKLTVLLAVPGRKPEGRNCSLSESEARDGSRYIAETNVLHDETTGLDQKPVRLGRKNIRLVLDTEVTDSDVTLPVGRIMRSGTGEFVFDAAYIPPCVQITASERLMALLGRLIEIMNEKSASLSHASEGGSGTKARFTTREVASFWLLHAINSGLASLRHLYSSKRGHPEELFLEMSRLAGALCTFGLDWHPRTLPSYNHQRLDECFEALDQHIRTHLEMIVPTDYVSIPLQREAEYLYTGEVSDQRCFGKSRWILGIHAGLGDADLIVKTPQLIKMCSRQFVPELVKRALPGLALTHLPVPPTAMPAKVESQYFAVSKAGPCWNHLMQTKRVGIYVPGEFPNPEIELLVVFGS